MKKLWQLIKEVCVACAGAVAGFVACLLLVKTEGRKADEVTDALTRYMEKETTIENKAETKREEVYERVAHGNATAITNSYSGACDAISDGIDRYRDRVQLLRTGH